MKLKIGRRGSNCQKRKKVPVSRHLPLTPTSSSLAQVTYDLDPRKGHFLKSQRPSILYYQASIFILEILKLTFLRL